MVKAPDSNAAARRSLQGACALPLRPDLTGVVLQLEGRSFNGRWEVCGPLLHLYSDYGDAVATAGPDGEANALLAQDLLAAQVRDLVRRPARVECEIENCRFSGRWKRVGDQVVMTSDYGIAAAAADAEDEESVARGLLVAVVERWRRA